MPIKVRIFLSVDLRDFFSDLGSGYENKCSENGLSIMIVEIERLTNSLC